MRRGFLGGLLLLLATGAAQAQPWPAPGWGYPGYPPAAYWQQPYYPAPVPGYPPSYAPVPAPYSYPAPARPGVNAVPTALPTRPLSAGNGSDPSPPQTTLRQAPDTTAPKSGTETPADKGPITDSELFGVDLPGDETANPVAAVANAWKGPYFRPHHETWWLSGGYMTAFLRPSPLNLPLVTSGSAKDSPPGALGQPGTAVLFGNDRIDYGTFHGGWMQVGFWLDPDNHYSLDLGGFLLAPQHQTYAVSSDGTGNPPLARPVFSLLSGKEAAFTDALPGVAAGGTLMDTRALLLGGEINLRCHAYWCQRLHADALIGFRTLHYEEGLQINDRVQPLVDNNFTFLGNVVNPPSTLADFDRFKSLNTFYGSNFGGRLQYEFDWCAIDLFGKVAVGVNTQTANIFGSSTLNTPTGSSTAAGGLLALPSNMGDHSRRTFGVAREAGVNLHFDPWQHWRFKVGYSFLVWNGVIRSGDMLDRVVNPGQVPTDQAFGTTGLAARPLFVFKDETLWVHILNLGMEFHY